MLSITFMALAYSMFWLIMGWELVMFIISFSMPLLLISPVLSSSEFIYFCGLQANVYSFLLSLLSLLSFFWAMSSVSLASQKISGQSILTLKTSLLIFLLIFFFSSETLNLYVAFELSVIPIFVIIMGWGYQSERLEASLSLMFYTITASLPLLGVFIFMFLNSLTSKILFLNYLISLNKSNLSSILIFSLMAAFLVKLPMYSVHLWLPKAHVEAPVYGSMVLAAILLKLGSFGILVFIPFIFLDSINVFISISIIGGVLVSMTCLRLTDIKMIIAYSSVAHMGCVLIPLMLASSLSATSGVLLMIAHGVSSSGMFLMSYFLYQMNFSRSLLLTKGVLVFSSSSALMWFLILMINMAAPPTLNLLSEILMISSVIYQNYYNFFLIVLIVLVGSAYTLIIYSSSVQGTKVNSLSNKIMTLSETLNIFNHLIWGFILILTVSLFNF